MKRLIIILLPILAYMLGSIPWGLVLTRAFGHDDIRGKGSGNIGATNVKRIAGTTLAVLTLVGDMLKGAVPVWIAVIVANETGVEETLYGSLVALSVFSGHLFPLFLKFKSGGKGVATATGCFLVLSPVACLVASLTFVLVVCFVNRVSAGSLAGAALLPIAVWISSQSIPLTGCALITTVLIYVRHRDNIKRLLSGKEPVLRDRKR